MVVGTLATILASSRLKIYRLLTCPINHIPLIFLRRPRMALGIALTTTVALKIAFMAASSVLSARKSQLLPSVYVPLVILFLSEAFFRASFDLAFSSSRFTWA
jgi:hypothetical protein